MRPFLGAAAVCLLVLTGCGDGSEGNDDAGDDAGDDAATTSTVPAPGEGAAPGRPVGEVEFASEDFADGAELPVELTCDGASRSPELHWSGLPDDTATVAVIVDDPDAPDGGFVHWVLWDVPADATIEAGGVAPDAREGVNGAGAPGWTGPCPPEGDGPHSYVFSLYAIPDPVDEAAGASADEARDAFADAGGREVAILTGRYER